MARRVCRNKNIALARAEPDSGIIFIASSLCGKRGSEQHYLQYDNTISWITVALHAPARSSSQFCVFHIHANLFSPCGGGGGGGGHYWKGKKRKENFVSQQLLSLSPDYFLHWQRERKEIQKFKNFLAGANSSGSLVSDFAVGFKLINARI